MKTIEQKAIAYDEALKWMRSLYPTMTGIDKEDAEHYFPELRESEDERIRGAIIDHLKDNNLTEWAAWLEKQKVLSAEEEIQGKKDVLWCIKQASKYAKDENEMGTCWFAEKWLEKQGEKKPVGCSEEDEIKIPFGTKDSELQEATYYIPKGFYAEIEGDKVVIKKGEKPTEWSEEDKVMLDEIIDFFENGTVKLQHDLSLYASWLKALKQRITNNNNKNYGNKRTKDFSATRLRDRQRK